jgi:hypothetical protein
MAGSLRVGNIKTLNIKLLVINSSHGRHHSPNDTGGATTPGQARKFLLDHFPTGTQSRAWGGLILGGIEFPKRGFRALTELSSGTKRKIREVKTEIRVSHAQVAVQVSGSNELKSFMVNDKDQVQIVEEWGVKTWKQLTSSQKSNFNPRKHRCLGKDAHDLVKKRVKTYVSNLVEIYADSELEYVFHVSILERICEKDTYLKNCNIYYAYANHFLKIELGRLNGVNRVKNRGGNYITWNFVAVSKQFFEANDPKYLFKSYERENGWMVHRTKEAMEALVEMYLAEVYKVLTTVGVIKGKV